MPGPAVIDGLSEGDGRSRQSLGAILGQDATRAVFQPVVELESGAIVGYEALARGPAGSPLARPDALFDAARAGDLVAELDWTCRAAAFGAALDAALPASSTLFVNVDPAALDVRCPARHRDVQERAAAELRVVVELTERSLTSRPAELLSAVETARARGWGVALDDIGADRRSLALMPLLRPDVLKLDLGLVQDRPTPEAAEIVAAVGAQAERTGASLLAEGVETGEHLTTARSLGATLGQGWRFGRPGPLPARFSGGAPEIPLLGRTAPAGGRTPHEILSAVKATRRGTKELLISSSRALERQAERLGETAVVIAAFQTAARFTARTRAFYSRLAARLAFVGAIGDGVEPAPAPGVRGAQLGADDPVHGEWALAVVGPHFAAALTGRDLGDGGPELERRFDFTVTYDRDLAVDCARSLFARIAPSGQAR